MHFAKGCLAGKNAGFTLGSAINSHNNFSVLVILLPRGKTAGSYPMSKGVSRAARREQCSNFLLTYFAGMSRVFG